MKKISSIPYSEEEMHGATISFRLMRSNGIPFIGKGTLKVERIGNHYCVAIRTQDRFEAAEMEIDEDIARSISKLPPGSDTKFDLFIPESFWD